MKVDMTKELKDIKGEVIPLYYTKGNPAITMEDIVIEALMWPGDATSITKKDKIRRGKLAEKCVDSKEMEFTEDQWEDIKDLTDKSRPTDIYYAASKLFEEVEEENRLADQEETTDGSTKED